MLYVKDPRAGHTGELPVMVPGVTGIAGFTVVVISLLNTVGGAAQTAFEIISTVILSPFTRVEVEKFGLLVPTFVVPLSFH